MTWQEQAACRGADPHLFDPIEHETSKRKRIEKALSYCRRCPVARACLTAALADMDSGVRGGHLLNRGSLIRLPAFERPGRSDLAPCGTKNAWLRHRRKKENCPDCESAREHARATKGAGRKKRAA